jgi:hypothetical protein
MKTGWIGRISKRTFAMIKWALSAISALTTAGLVVVLES